MKKSRGVSSNHTTAAYNRTVGKKPENTLARKNQNNLLEAYGAQNKKNNFDRNHNEQQLQSDALVLVGPGSTKSAHKSVDAGKGRSEATGHKTSHQVRVDQILNHQVFDGSHLDKSAKGLPPRYKQEKKPE